MEAHGLHVSPGRPLPLGATPDEGGVNFAVVSAHASAVTLVLFRRGEQAPVLERRLDAVFHRTGDVWHAFVHGAGPGLEWGWRVEGEPLPPSRRREPPTSVLLDPYARSVAGAEEWGGEAPRGKGIPLSAAVRPRRGRVLAPRPPFGDEPPHPCHELSDSLIYEVHLRGFTAHPSSGVRAPGTYRGFTEKIPHLRALGVTAVELLPVAEFEERDVRPDDPAARGLLNSWGYQPLAYFAPRSAWASSPGHGSEVDEFREMVRALHGAGIEVILDVVYNHTGELDETGATVSLRGLDDAGYYHLEPDGRYKNFAGCGNALSANHPPATALILDSLRYWVVEMGVDGFRFDLASVLTRDRDGRPLDRPPVLEAIAGDPVLADTKLIAEAWDAAGLYQVGGFPHFGRFAEWNGRYRDDLRRFLRGDGGMVGALATRLAGSSDLYQRPGRGPHHSVNFVTAHDGFTLADLVSYHHKRNQRNGHHGRDGTDDNLSWNCGAEGPTADPAVRALRERQARNFVTLLMLSQGVPMILGGDEIGRTQGGNNNAYSQDDETSWFDWTLAQGNASLLRFFQLLSAFRRAHPNLRRRAFAEPGDAPWLHWHGTRLFHPDWSEHSHALALHLLGLGRDDDILALVNGSDRPLRFELPPLPGERRWRRAVDTHLPPPADACVPGAEAPLRGQRTHEAPPRSVTVLVGR